MGWLGALLSSVVRSDPSDMIVVPLGSAQGIPGVNERLVPDECYVELYVESMRLTHARRLASRFHGVVYSFVSLARDGEPSAQLAAVSKPEKLADLDSDSLDNVITVSKRMMGAVPWRGGTVSLELGLFSVKAGNLLSPVLDYVVRVSSTAGLSFVGAVKPFLPLITEGMDLIAGQRQDTAIEVAIDTDLALSNSGVWAIIAARKGELDSTQVSIDPRDNKLLLAGQALKRGYCVFSIRHTLQKPDFGEIPDLKEKYAALQAAIRANKVTEAKDALVAFRLATIASPDLISVDARRLVQRTEQKLAEAFPGGGISRKQHGAAAVEELASIGLYD